MSARIKSVGVRFPNTATLYHYLCPAHGWDNPKVGDFILTNTNFGIAYPEGYADRVASTPERRRSFASRFGVAIVAEVQTGTPHERAVKEYVLWLADDFFQIREAEVVGAHAKRQAKAKAQKELDRLIADFAAKNIMQQLIAINPETKRLYDLVNS